MQNPTNSNPGTVPVVGKPAGSATPGVVTNMPVQPPMAAPKIAQPFFVGRSIDEMIDYQNILFYGDYGAGKTTLAATALLVEDMRDILFISIEGGEKALKEVARMARKMGIDPSRILVIPVQTFNQFANIYEALKIHLSLRDSNNEDGLRGLEAQLKYLPPEIQADKETLRQLIPKPLKFRTVIIDSLSEAHKLGMYQVLGVNPATQRIDVPPNAAQWGDWGGTREMVQFLVRRFRDLPVHAIFTAAESIEQDNLKVFHHEPMLSGKLSNDVRGLVDTVGYLMVYTNEMGQQVRRCVLRSLTYDNSQHVKAKHRYGSNLEGAWIDNATMQDFEDLNNM